MSQYNWNPQFSNFAQPPPSSESVRRVTSVYQMSTSVSDSNGIEKLYQREVKQVVEEVSISGHPNSQISSRYVHHGHEFQSPWIFNGNRVANPPPTPRLAPATPRVPSTPRLSFASHPPSTPRISMVPRFSANSQLAIVPTWRSSQNGHLQGRLNNPLFNTPYGRPALAPRTPPQRTSCHCNQARMVEMKDKATQVSPQIMFEFMEKIKRRTTENSPVRYSMHDA